MSKKKFNKGTEARRLARKSGIAPAHTRVIEDKRKRPPKHKKKWLVKEVVESKSVIAGCDKDRPTTFSEDCYLLGSTEPSFSTLNRACWRERILLDGKALRAEFYDARKVPWRELPDLSY
ncbi:MAG: hypothetical protein QOJ41_1325 [Acidobacteriaceae bacterium]|nr:hypothetical protein [Acidobacteriaceae bacterium]